MGTTTNGQICYGILFDEDFEFPWSERDGIDDWWREVNGYENPCWNPFTPEGDYKAEIVTNTRVYGPVTSGYGMVTSDDPRIQEYFQHQRNWDKEHPLPIELVNCCSCDCPIWILAAPASTEIARRGYPSELDLRALKVNDVAKAPGWRANLLEFCDKYKIEHDEPRWWLSSYWG